jgi:hypothetical protein
MDQPATPKRATGLALLLFAAFWCTLVGVFDTLALRGTLNQWQAHRDFVPVDATVLSSDIREEDGEDGTAYIPVIRYEYSANNIRHESDRLRYGQPPTSRRTAKRIVSDHPPGKPIQAFIDPTDPTRSVLFPKLKGSDLTLIVFLVPFNAIGVYLLSASIASLLGRSAPLANSNPWRPASPLTSALAALLGIPAVICFIATFIFAFGWSFNPPLEAPLAVLAASAVLGLWCAVRSLIGAHATPASIETMPIPADQPHRVINS